MRIITRIRIIRDIFRINPFFQTLHTLTCFYLSKFTEIREHFAVISDAIDPGPSRFNKLRYVIVYIFFFLVHIETNDQFFFCLFNLMKFFDYPHLEESISQ